MIHVFADDVHVESLPGVDEGEAMRYAALLSQVMGGRLEVVEVSGGVGEIIGTCEDGMVADVRDPLLWEEIL